MRDSAKPRALQRQIEFLNDKGAGKTADKKVLLEAADRILERDSDRRQGVTVNVGVTAQITPGYAYSPAAEARPRRDRGRGSAGGREGNRAQEGARGTPRCRPSAAHYWGRRSVTARKLFVVAVSDANAAPA